MVFMIFFLLNYGMMLHDVAVVMPHQVLSSAVPRIPRIIRVLRIFRFVLALRTLVQSTIHTLKSLFWALVLLGLIIYVFLGANPGVMSVNHLNPWLAWCATVYQYEGHLEYHY